MEVGPDVGETEKHRLRPIQNVGLPFGRAYLKFGLDSPGRFYHNQHFTYYIEWS